MTDASREVQVRVVLAAAAVALTVSDHASPSAGSLLGAGRRG